MQKGTVKKKDEYKLLKKTTVLERFKEKGVLHPAAQLIIYQHFIEGVEGARFYFLKESSKDRVVVLPPEQSATADELMSAIRERLDEIIGGKELLPEHNCQECEYCQFQVLCGREAYYKASRGNN